MQTTIVRKQSLYANNRFKRTSNRVRGANLTKNTKNGAPVVQQKCLQINLVTAVTRRLPIRLPKNSQKKQPPTPFNYI